MTQIICSHLVRHLGQMECHLAVYIGRLIEAQIRSIRREEVNRNSFYGIRIELKYSLYKYFNILMRDHKVHLRADLDQYFLAPELIS